MHPPLSKNHIRALTGFLALLACALLPLNAHAQLYTWKDTQGNVIIKNSPPPWYSENERSRGARVQVLRNGKLIDDTAWPADRRQEGRNTSARQEARQVLPERAAQPAKKEDDN